MSGLGRWLRDRPWIWVVLGLGLVILANIAFVVWAEYSAQAPLRG